MSLALSALRILTAVRSIVPVKLGPTAKTRPGKGAVPAPPVRRVVAPAAASTTPTWSSRKTTTSTSHPSASALHLTSLKGHDAGVGGVTGLVWSACGDRLASAGADRAIRVAAVPADPATTRPGPPVKRALADAALGVAFVPQPSAATPAVAVLTRGVGTGAGAPTLAALGQGRTPLWSLPAAGDTFLGGHRALALRTGAGVLAVASEKTQLEVFNLPASGAAPTRLAAIDTAGVRTHDLAVSADGAWVAAATFAPDVRLHAVLKGGRVLRGPVLGGHGQQVLAVSLSADGSAAATSCRDGTVAVWGLPRWTRHDTEEAGPPARLRWRAPAPVPAGFAYRRLALDPSGTVLAAGTDRGDIHFLDATTGGLLAAVEPAHAGAVTALDWAVARGRKAVLASAGEDGAIHLWASPADVTA